MVEWGAEDGPGGRVLCVWGCSILISFSHLSVTTPAPLVGPKEGTVPRGGTLGAVPRIPIIIHCLLYNQLRRVK